MPEDIKLPGVGEVKKKYVYVGAVAVAGIVAFAYYRSRNAKVSADTTSTSGGIDPNAVDPTSPTGATYAEESAGAGTYADYASGYDTGALGGGGYGPSGFGLDPYGYDQYGQPVPPPASTPAPAKGFTNNEQWLAEAEKRMPGNSATVATALLKVLGGVRVSNEQRQLFLEAKGLLGDPPDGYPKPIKLKDTPQHPGTPDTHVIDAPGNETLWQIAHRHGISEYRLIALNPQLAKYFGSKKNIPHGTKVRV